MATLSVEAMRQKIERMEMVELGARTERTRLAHELAQLARPVNERAQAHTAVNMLYDKLDEVAVKGRGRILCCNPWLWAIYVVAMIIVAVDAVCIVGAVLWTGSMALAMWIIVPTLLTLGGALLLWALWGHDYHDLVKRALCPCQCVGGCYC
jgi:hypothetical protein